MVFQQLTASERDPRHDVDQKVLAPLQQSSVSHSSANNEVAHLLDPQSWDDRNDSLYMPSLTKEKALLAANIALQMVKGMTTLYAEAGPREKPLIIAEYKKALTLYLGSVLSEDERSTKKRQQ